MTQGLKERISRLVRDDLGIRTAIAVFAALELAEQRWSEVETQEYGTAARDIVLGKTGE